MIKVLVVCTGNTCRSAMAQELLDDAVDRSSSPGGKVKCASAGTFACEGAEATREAIEVMDEIGLSIDKHRAQQFTEELAEKFDILLAVDPIVFEQMEAIAPDELGKMHSFLGFAEGLDGEQTDEMYSVIDPFDEEIERYRECVAQMRTAAEKIAARIEKEYND